MRMPLRRYRTTVLAAYVARTRRAAAYWQVVGLTSSSYQRRVLSLLSVRPRQVKMMIRSFLGEHTETKRLFNARIQGRDSDLSVIEQSHTLANQLVFRRQLKISSNQYFDSWLLAANKPTTVPLVPRPGRAARVQSRSLCARPTR